MRARWLGRAPFADAHALQRALFEHAADPYLLLLEHPHVYTLGLRGSLDHVLVEPADLGAELVRTDRGGDVTYHGPGQLVGYPILSWPTGPDATPAYVRSVEQLVIDVCTDVGLPDVGRVRGYPGVWVDPDGADPRKVCAIGVRRSRGRTMHGFALNVDPDLAWFDKIVPCGISGRKVTSLAAEGVDVTMTEVVDRVVARAAAAWDGGQVEVVALDGGRPSLPGEIGGLPIAARKPQWLRVQADMGPAYREIKRTMRSLDLVTVCEEAGCPNIFECWNDGTATFMVNGDRCTRACKFCLVDTRRPSGPPDPGEPAHVAEAVAEMGLAHAVVTAVARDDLADGGAAAMAETVRAIRRRCPGTTVEVLIPDCKGDPAALAVIFEARPDVLNHNLETVARLQRLVRPSASYVRSLAVLGRARAAGLVTKSGLIVGMGETDDEVLAAMADLRNVGVDILTVGQYLRPTSDHLPVARWWTPDEFARLADAGRAMGFAHVEASPLTRSSYHARQAAEAASGPGTAL
ncbi:MAG: lipoyl synthase, partial [Actinomycetota bacterium]|nr:lipoyl synthase [Actinomycetota bacterium]